MEAWACGFPFFCEDDMIEYIGKRGKTGVKFLDNGCRSIVLSDFLIIDYLMKMPAEHVKAFLYLKVLVEQHADREIEQIAQDLELELPQLVSILDDFIQKKLVIRREDGGYQLCEPVPPSQTYIKDQQSQSAYADREFNKILQVLFGGRTLTLEEYHTIYDLIDVFHLPKEVVIVLIEHCIKVNSKGTRVSMQYIKKAAVDWAEKGVDCLEKAEMEMARHEMLTSNVMKVLKALSIYRLPTKAEFELYQKWTKTWGFTLDGIMMAMKQTSKAREPSMKYLDGILGNLYAQNKITAGAIDGHFERQEDMDRPIKRVLERLSYVSLKVSPEHRSQYLAWVKMGFGQEEILYACSLAIVNGKKSFGYVNKILENWAQHQKYTLKKIKAWEKSEKKQRDLARQMLSAMGSNRPVSKLDEERYVKFTGEYGFSHELILLAAQKSRDAKNPAQYMHRILKNWKQDGIATLEQAQETFQKRTSAAKAKFDYSQRNYGKGELDQLVDDITKDIDM